MSVSDNAESAQSQSRLTLIDNPCAVFSSCLIGIIITAADRASDHCHRSETRSAETALIIMMILSDQHVRLGQLWLGVGHRSEA